MTIISIAYTALTYVSFIFGIASIWFHLSGTSLSTFIQSYIVYAELQEKYPTIIFEDDDYVVPCRLQTIKVILWIIFSLMLALLVYCIHVFVINSETIFGFVILQFMSFLSIVLVILSFILNGYSCYCGNAYCDKRMLATNKKINYCFIPSSLNEDQLTIYKEERKLT